MTDTQTFSIPYGKSCKRVTLPEANCLGCLDLPNLPALADAPGSILGALRKPIAADPLVEWVKGAKRVVVTCPDITREAQASAYLPLLVDELNRAGVPDAAIELCFALGTHREMTHAEKEKIAGRDVLKRVEFFQSRGDVEEDFQLIGETKRGTPLWFNRRVLSADRIISTGTIVFHNFAGFGGGRKGLLPGIARRDTVMQNHSLMLLPEIGAGLNPKCTTGILSGNPIHEDMLEAALRVPNVFLFNTVLNVKKEIAGVFAGDLRRAHAAGVAMVEQWFGVPIRQQADFVVFSPGGFPRDISFYQGFRSMGHAARVVRKGGIIVMVAECPEGAGGAERFRQWFDLPDRLAIDREMRRDFDNVAMIAWDMHGFLKTIRVISVSAMSDEETEKLLMEPAPSVEEALDRAFKQLGPRAKGYVMPQGSFTVPIFQSK